jgi:hypothetical protein
VSESNSRSWKEPFLEALFETDKEKLTKLVYTAEGAMFLRSQELAGSSDHHEERSELQVACAALLTVQVNKLGWPCTLPKEPGWPLSPSKQASPAERLDPGYGKELPERFVHSPNNSRIF